MTILIKQNSQLTGYDLSNESRCLFPLKEKNVVALSVTIPLSFLTATGSNASVLTINVHVGSWTS